MRDRGIGDVLAADPPEVTFGVQPREAAATRRVAFSNRKGRAIELSSIRVSGDGFRIVSAPPVPFTIGAGERVEIDLTFQSATPCRCSGTVSVGSNLPSGTVGVRLHARVR